MKTTSEEVTLTPYIIRDCDFVMKLEPIVNIESMEVVSFEFLSRPTDCSLNNEVFFKCLTVDEIFNLFQRQLEIFQKLNEQNPDFYSSVFYNVPVELLYNIETIGEMYPFLDRFKINLEVECDCRLFLKDPLLRKVSKSFIRNDINVWLDDVDICHLEVCGLLIKLGVIYGIKLDKHAFWGCYHGGQELKKFFTNFRDRIIVEGIETFSHLHYARAQSMTFGQGYFWKSQE